MISLWLSERLEILRDLSAFLEDILMRRNENKKQISSTFSRSSQLSNFASTCISTTSFHYSLSILTFAMSSRRVFTRVKKIIYRAIAAHRMSSSSTSQIRDNQSQSTLNFFIAFIFFETTFFSSQMKRLMIEVETEKTTQSATRKKTKQIAQLKKRLRVLKRNRFSIEIFDDWNDDRRFFLNNNNEFIFFSFIKMFSIVNRKHFQNIWREAFLLENLSKFSNDYFARDVIIVDDDETFVVDLKDLAHLIKCFEIYCQIVIEFAHIVTRFELQKTLIMYRIRLITLVINYTFKFLLFFHKTFVYARICEDQDDSEIWRLIDKQLEDPHLVRRVKNNFLKTKTFIYSLDDKKRLVKVFVDYCRRFNNDLKCEEYNYKYVCVICQSSNHEQKKCKQTTTRSNKISVSRRSWLLMISNYLLCISEKSSYEMTILEEFSLMKSNLLIINSSIARLEDHSNRCFANALMRIFNHDAKIEYIDSFCLNLIENHIFVNNAFDLLIVDLNKQLNAHRITQVVETSFKHFISSSLNLILKVDERWRRIHDLFYSKVVKSIFVNAHISKTWDALKYTTFDETLKTLAKQNEKATLIKRDLFDAFKHILVAKSNWWLLRFFWDDHYYIDRFLSFELRIAFFLFDLITKALH